MWAAVQAFVITQAVTIATDLQTWVDWIDPQGTEVGPERLDVVAAGAVYLALSAAVISAAIALSRVHSPFEVRTPLGTDRRSWRPRSLRRSLRGKIYAAYVPVDVVLAAAVIVAHRQMIGPTIVPTSLRAEVPIAFGVFVVAAAWAVASLIADERDARSR